MFNPNIVQIIISVLIIKSRHTNIPTDDNLGDDVDGRESATIVMKTAIASSSVIPNPIRSPESTGNTNTNKFRTPNKTIGNMMLIIKNVGLLLNVMETCKEFQLFLTYKLVPLWVFTII